MLAAAAVYCRDLQYDFILDDVPLILMNETITSWKNWGTLFVSDIVPEKGVDIIAVHYRPIYTLWLMLNDQVFGMVLPWWHLTSLLLHLLAVLLVYKVGMKVRLAPWTAALAAVIFAVHPIHVESVSYVSASTDVLVAVFLLTSFLTYAHFREHGGGDYWYLASAVFTGALAMLSKETAAILPFMLFAYEAVPNLAPHRQPFRKRLLATLPFFAVVAGYGVARTLLFGRNLGPGPEAGASRLSVWLDAPLVLLAYLRNLVWPTRLSFFYPDELGAHWTLAKGLALALCLVAVLLLWKYYKGRPGVRMQLIWLAIFFFIPLASVSALRKQDWVHDRHMYLVSVPFCLVAAAVLTDIRLPRNLAVTLGSLVTATLLLLTATDVPRFKDELSIYESALKVAPHNVLLRRRYAAALWNKVPQVRVPSDSRDRALHEYVVNIQMWPELELGYENYGAVLAQMGRDEEAATQYRKALRLDTGGPSHLRASILYRLAALDLKLSLLDEAENSLREALSIDPMAISYHAQLAQVLKLQGRGQEADDESKLEAKARGRVLRDKP